MGCKKKKKKKTTHPVNNRTQHTTVFGLVGGCMCVFIYVHYVVQQSRTQSRHINMS
jgi:hypothetical protein